MEETNYSTIDLKDEMKSSYLDYSMSVIVSRALPDVRDGLKPVHRRIIYGMQGQGLLPNRSFSKSARLVGDVMAKYHPHGDLAIYDAVARLAQNWNMRYPLVEGQGNFGSIDGDGAAAPRYTELRMQSLTLEMLRDINKETVDFVENYDGEDTEPVVLPSRFPNLLVNGSSGIAVGMSTNMAPHNLRESIDGTIALLRDPDISIDDLNEIITGPDFPTGGIIMGRTEIKKAYRTGRGKIKLRAKAEIQKKGSQESIIITEIPYQVNKANLIKRIATLTREKKIEGITYLRDASDRKGLKIVIDISRSFDANIVLNNLYRQTQMETTFGIINLALVDGIPKVLNLKEILEYYAHHQIDVVTRRKEFDLRKAKDRLHIVEGYLVAIDNIDEIIKIIRESYSDAKERLMKRFEISEIQAQAILDMQLRRLQGLEEEKLVDERKELLETIKYLESVLASDEKLRNIIIEELEEIKEKFGDDRRTEIGERAESYELHELIEEEDVVITYTNNGYIKRTPVSTFRTQARGGRGVVGASSRDGDFVQNLLITNTHDELLFFTNLGRVYQEKSYSIPEAGRTARGQAIVNILPLKEKEEVTAIISMAQASKGKEYLVMQTRGGIIKKIRLDEFENIRSTGIIAIGLDDGDELIRVCQVEENSEVMITTKEAYTIYISLEDVRSVGRTARGVIGIRLDEGDEVISLDIIREDYEYIFFVTENGYGKKTLLHHYGKQNRGGKGVRSLNITEKTGDLVQSLFVSKENELLIISKNGDMIRIKASDVSTQGRYSSGVKVKNVQGEEDQVATATKYIDEKEV